MDVADTIVVMDDGRIEQVGSPRELYEHPANAVRDELRGSGDPRRTTSWCARTTSTC